MQQLPLRLGPGPAQSFESYVTGANGAALAAVRGLAAGAAPVYLWGPPGSGKTHLLQAAARASGEAELLLLDGCEGFDATRQHEAFALFVEAQTAGVPVLAAGRLPPVDLALREDLRTRLASGLVFELQPLGDAQTLAALQGEARRRGIALSDEVAAYLLNHFARDLGSLMALLDALDDFALARKRALTVPLLKDMLAERQGA